MATVVLDKVNKVFRGARGEAVEAVRDVSLSIAEGEFVVLVGPSGCGKSTTLRMVAGLEEITSGTIAIDGRVVNDVEPKDRDLAMVFQNYALYPHMTVYENMAFGLKLRNRPRTEIRQRVEEAAALLGLTGLLDRLPKALSGGQRQRVAVGRALVRQPRVFLFDEPLSNLDARMRVQMRLEIARLHDRLGATMIYVTHDQVEAMTMGDRIVVMHEGRVQQVAVPIELYQRPANLFVAGFIGSPPMNLLPGRVTGDANGRTIEIEDGAGGGVLVQLPVPDEAARRLDPFPGTKVHVGFRPETIRCSGGSTAAGSGTMDGVLELVEPLGAETLWHVAVGGHRLVARVEASAVGSVGSTVRLEILAGDAHLFDVNTGRSLLDEAGPLSGTADNRVAREGVRAAVDGLGDGS